MRIDSMDATSRHIELNVDKSTSVNLEQNQEAQKSVQTQTEKPAKEDPQQVTVSDKVVAMAVEKANKAMIGANRSLEFSVHEKTNKIIVRVIDTETKEVVREIPSEKILNMVSSMMEMAGLLVDERG